MKESIRQASGPERKGSCIGPGACRPGYAVYTVMYLFQTPNFQRALQQTYGDSVLDEAPLLWITNGVGVYFLTRNLNDVTNKTLRASPPVYWDGTGAIKPLAAFLFFAQLANDLQPKGQHVELPASSVLLTPEKGYKIADITINAAVQQDLVQAIEQLPVLGVDAMGLTGHLLSSSNINRVFLGHFKGKQVVLKCYNVVNHSAVQSFVNEVEAYLNLKSVQGVTIPPLYQVCRLDGNGALVLIIGHAQPVLEVTQTIEDRAWAALHSLHQCGRVHGDVRLSNLLVHKQHVWLTDLEHSRSTAQEHCSLDDAQKAKKEDIQRLQACLEGQEM